MKYFTFIIGLFLVGWTSQAKTATYPNSPYKTSNAIIFVERGVEFAIYPNGEFDFNFNPNYSRQASYVFTPFKNIRSYNSGYDYGRYVQYDDYGAVIQIENVPVYYDYYGRITQAGRVDINYNHRGQVSRVGGLNVHYNRFNKPYRYTGFINAYNNSYDYRPWHKYYSRPADRYRVVYYQPYRAYYEPMRMDYDNYVHHHHQHNKKLKKKKYYRPGQQGVVYNNGRRTSAQRSVHGVETSSEVRMNKPRQSQNARVRSNTSVQMNSKNNRSESIDYRAARRTSESTRGRNIDTSTRNRRGLTETEIRDKYSRNTPNSTIRSNSRGINTEADKPRIEDANVNVRGRSRVYSKPSASTPNRNVERSRNTQTKDSGIKAIPATSKANIRSGRGRTNVMN